MPKLYFNHLSNSFIVIVLFHLLVSFFIGDSYNYTRILINTLLSVFTFIVIIKYQKVVLDTIINNKFIFIFLLIPIIQLFYSQYIDGKEEVYQQVLISTTYLISAFLVLFSINFSKKISLKKFLNTIVLINILIFTFIFIYFFLFFEYINLMDTIKRFFTNIRFLNHLQTLFIPLLLFYLSLIKSNQMKILISILLIINFNLLFYTGARGNLYAIAIASIFIYFISNKQIKKDIIFLLFISVISFLFYQIFSFIGENEKSHISHLSDFSSEGRLYIYTTISTYLFDIKYTMQAIGFASEDIAYIDWLHPHNILLYIFLGFGSISLLIFIAFLINYLLKIYIKIISNKSKIKIYLFFIFISLFLHSMVSGLYIVPLSLLLISYFLIIFNSYFFKIKKSSNKYSNKLIKNSILLGAFIISLINIIYTKNCYDLYIKYNFTKEEKENKELTKRRVPGILLFDSKIKL